MPTIELFNGYVQNSKGNFSLWTQVRTPPDNTDKTLQAAVKDPKSGVSEPGGIIESVPSHKLKGKGGSWTKRRIECRDGIYLKMSIRLTDYSKRFGGLPEQRVLAFYIRPRANAALRELEIALPFDELSTYSTLYITGRFDIVEPKELGENKLFVNGEQNDIALFDPQLQAGIVKDRVLEGEVAPRLQLKSKSFGKKTLSRPSRVRRIRPIKS